MTLEIIPVVEMPPSEAGFALMKNKTLLTPRHRHEQEWLAFEHALSEHFEISFPMTCPVGSGLYPVDQLSDAAIQHVVSLHCADFGLSECCALFGGFVWILDGVAVLVPQCCGTVADVKSLQQSVQDNRIDRYLMLGGHPCPHLKQSNDTLTLTYEKNCEQFQPPADTFVMPVTAFRESAQQAVALVATFAERLDQLIDSHEQPSKTLVYERV